MTTHGARLVPFGLASIVAFLALILLAIAVRSPYTHANLDARVDPLYSRTDPIAVGTAAPYAGISPVLGNVIVGDTAGGARLYLAKGCAACHGLKAQGAVVGPRIAGSELGAVLYRTREPKGGMPRYSTDTLADADAAAIAAYLRSLAAPPAR